MTGNRYQLVDLRRGIGAALCQGANLGGNDREAPTSLPCPRGLDPGVEGQKVGLERDVVDHRNDFANMAGGLFNPMHGLNRILNHLAADLRFLPCIVHRVFDAFGIIGG